MPTKNSTSPQVESSTETHLMMTEVGFPKTLMAKHLALKNKDFLNFDLPKTDYKVFSNIPFDITLNDIRLI